MTVRSIYDCALRMLGENAGSCAEGEFEERAPYIAAALCREARVLDSQYRRAFGDADGEVFDGLTLKLDSTFPLSDRFAPAAAYYMAAMLILDENRELYEKLFDMWCDALATISCEIPYVKSSTVQKYHTY